VEPYSSSWHSQWSADRVLQVQHFIRRFLGRRLIHSESAF
jgi:hypothetical protein